MHTWRLAIVFTCLLASGCAQYGYRDQGLVASNPCGDEWNTFQRPIADAGVFDAQDWPLPAYPFLRIDRSASYLAQGELSEDQRRAWLLRAYENGYIARGIEADRLDSPPPREALETCLRQSLSQLVNDRSFWDYVREHPRPDAYNDFARAIGLYPVFQPFISWRVATLIEEVEQEFQHYRAEFPWRRYAPERRAEWTLVQQILEPDSHRDALGLPQFTATELDVLFAYYSPIIEQEVGDPDDRLGRPRHQNGSWTVSDEPQLFTRQTHTRWNGEWLPQLVYQWWYPARPKNHALDIYGGELDGLIFRVTLDWNGRVLFYDSIHPCGCYHKWYPAQSAIQFSGTSTWQEPLTVLPVSPPTQPHRAVLRVKTRSHYVVGLAFESLGADAADQTYSLHPEIELRRNALGDRYLFAPDGLVHGTERLERFLLWNMGVPSAGAMRQWGHHAVAFAGRRHFDDPELFERYFNWQPRADR